MASDDKPAAVWSFCNQGSVTQVLLRHGADIAALEHLDQKLWMALSIPTRGIEFDARTADLLDADRDGRIRPPDILAAIKWLKTALHDLDELIRGGDTLPLAAIKDQALLAGARRILANLGRTDAQAISLTDVTDRDRIFANTRFNGDGIITPENTEDDTLAQAVRDINSTVGAKIDRGGQPGLDQELLHNFLTQTQNFLAWVARPEQDATIAPLGVAATTAALAAVHKLKPKLDDYFTRCRLAEFDPRARAALNPDQTAYGAMSAQTLNEQTEAIAGLPLAPINPGQPLALQSGINPAWSDAAAQMAELALIPLLQQTTLTAAEWQSLQARLAPCAAWLQAKPETTVETLGRARLTELTQEQLQTAMHNLFAQDTALREENAQIAALEKLLHFRRDLFTLLTNSVNFSDFYRRQRAIFEAGTLYLDGRACNLCITVTDQSRHAMLAGMSGAFLAYCDLTRHDQPARSIVAVITDGASYNLMAGRNGLFYDRQGRDWDATITKIVSNPISIREAFWMPYKKFVRFIEEQIAKRAQAADQAATAKLSDAAGQLAEADKLKTTRRDVPPGKLDLGTIALIGTAIGGISALVGGFLQALFGLGFWLPVGALGIILLISGPSMLLASLKLRQRNLAPILDASGWAINTRARVNTVFGAALTELARLPPGSRRLVKDPFADRHRGRIILIGILLAALGLLWWSGRLDRCLPTTARRAAAAAEPAPAAAPDQTSAGND